MKSLVGKTIKELWVSKDQYKLAFVTDQNDIIGFEVAGDCCSESWFADITGVDFLLNSTVVSVEDVCMSSLGESDGRSRQVCDEIYCYKFKTNNGHAEVIFRNSSNGYYGGWCSKCFFEIKDVSDMIKISTDWSA